MKIIKNKIRNREFVCGGWVSFSDPGIAETFACAGFDFVAIDMEHTDISIQQAKNIIMACHARNVPCLPRPVSHNNDFIKPLLESGADGMFFPMVQDIEDIENLSRNFYYTPTGNRSYGVNRAHDFGLKFDTYVNNWNNRGVFIPQIESVTAVENIDNIVSHEAVDGVMVGPYDLSGSLGVPGQTTSKVVKEACQKVIAACKQHMKGCCTQIQTPTKESISESIKNGYTFIILGSDLFILSDWATKTSNLFKSLERNNT